MDKIKQLKMLFVTEETDTNKWFVTFKLPMFQNKKEALEVDEETAKELLKIQFKNK